VDRRRHGEARGRGVVIAVFSGHYHEPGYQLVNGNARQRTHILKASLK